MRPPTRSVCVSCVFAALLSSPASAVLLTAESFDYPNATGQGLNTLNGGTGWSAGWSDNDGIPTLAMSNLSLVYPSGVVLSPHGGRIEVTGTATSNGASRLLQTSTPLNLALNGQVYYSSALFRRSAITGQLTSVLFERASDGVVRWYYGIDENGFFSVAVDPGATNQRATTSFTAEPDTTYLIVARMRTNTAAGSNDEVFLKIFKEGDFVSEPPTDAGWDIRASGNSGVTLDRMRLAMSNTAGETNEFDELRIGTSFADVTGIPEPSSAALLAVGALMLARRRR